MMKIGLTFKHEQDSELVMADQLEASARRSCGLIDNLVTVPDRHVAVVAITLAVPWEDAQLWHDAMGPCDDPECPF